MTVIVTIRTTCPCHRTPWRSGSCSELSASGKRSALSSATSRSMSGRSAATCTPPTTVPLGAGTQPTVPLGAGAQPTVSRRVLWYTKYSATSGRPCSLFLIKPFTCYQALLLIIKYFSYYQAFYLLSIVLLISEHFDYYHFFLLSGFLFIIKPLEVHSLHKRSAPTG